MEKVKTHWMQNPNKNYLGNWDLPGGEDMTLTIKSVDWEGVKNPKTNTSKDARVIRFMEDVKPFICNETNAKMIMKVTGEKYMDDSVGKRITLYVSQTMVKREQVDCLRIREESPDHNFDNTLALKKLRECESLSDLQGAYMALGKNEKADKEVVALKDELKTKLS